MTAVVFKSKKPLVMNAYDAQRDVDIAIFNAKCDAFKELMGTKELRGIQYFDGGWAITSFHIGYGKSELPVGWRRERNSDVAVPAKRTPEGKEWAKKLRDLTLKGNTYPGVPNTFHTDVLNGQGFSVYPRTVKFGDDWWLTLSKTPMERDLAKIDPELWEPAKLSEFYAAKEAHDDE